MSASAIKPTMPGVGPSAPPSSHSMLPMNAIAQKVVPGTESSAAMKPLNNSGLSYVTLQPPPAQQPLSLVQDHRSPVYQAQAAYTTNSTEPKSPQTQPEPEKIVANGVESLKPTDDEAKQAVETNRNNNLSPETPSSDVEAPKSAEIAEETPIQQKMEEKKSPINNGTKENAETTPKKEEPKAETPQKKTQTPTKSADPSPSQKSDIKIATTPRAVKRKSRELKDLKGNLPEGGSKPKRNRVQTQPYQSPLPEYALIVKTLTKTPANKNADDKLIVFYKNEFLAVRNSEGSFYVCQAMQNIYKSSRRIRIRWLSQDKNNGEIYSPDFYDLIDFDCILTNLNLNKVDKNKFQLTKIELLRTENILKRAIDVEAGVSEKPSVTEEHPDGIDLSLYTDESQLKRRKSSNKQKQRQRRRSKREASSSEEEDSSSEDENEKKNQKGRKKTTNKALAIAKSVAKMPVRAKRTSARSTVTNIDEKRNDTKKPDVKKGKPNTTTPAVAAAAAATAAAATAAAAVAAAAAAAAAAASSTTTRTKLRGTGDSTEVTEKNDKTTTGRTKRLATTIGTITTTEDSASRKKSRGSRA